MDEFDCPDDDDKSEQKTKKKPKDLSQTAAQAAVMRFLSRREYSKQELRQRLQQKGFSDEITNSLLQRLEEDNWQSDYRCAEMLFSHGYKSGWGPKKVIAQIFQKGISADIIEQIFKNINNQYTQSFLSAESSCNGSVNETLTYLQELIDDYQAKELNNHSKAALIAANFEPLDWNKKALEAAWKKFGVRFGQDLARNIKNKAKLQRFLYNKGFESEHISYVLKNYNN